MRPIKIYYILTILIFVSSCEKTEDQTLSDLSVQEYIDLLQSDKYTYSQLPEFSAKDIPLLLEHRNDDNIVNNFPANPISSFLNPEANHEIGVLVLWTIESIRAVSIDSEYLIGRFPSQNPFVQLRSDPYDWILDHNHEAYSIISQAYFDWWNNNKNKNFIEYDQIDPISNTDYKWH